MSLTKESLQRMLDRNPVLTIRGKIGDFYVSENRKGKTVVTGGPVPAAPMTEVQMGTMERFNKATAYAKTAIVDRRLGPFYEAAGAFWTIPPFAAAVRDYLRSPEIARIDTERFQGRRWDSIVIHAEQRFEFAYVRVFIVSEVGRLIEENYAAVTPGEDAAIYILQRAIRPSQTVQILVFATDHGGNETFKALASAIPSDT